MKLEPENVVCKIVFCLTQIPNALDKHPTMHYFVTGMGLFMVVFAQYVL